MNVSACPYLRQWCVSELYQGLVLYMLLSCAELCEPHNLLFKDL